MQQSNVIFAFLLIAFVVYITNKGELPIYMGFLLGGNQQVNTGGAYQGYMNFGGSR